MSVESTHQTDMADERTSEGHFDLEACLKAIMAKLDHTAETSDTALKMAQENQQKMADLEQNGSKAHSSGIPHGAGTEEGPQSNENTKTRGESSSKPEVTNLEGEAKGKSTSSDSVLASKVEALERTIKGIRRADDMVDVRTLSLFPTARIPLQFKMPELEKFDGTGCPKTHLKMYVRAMHPRGATDELLAQMFHETLATSALKWFLSLDENRTRTWEDICNEFSEHYC